MTDDPRPPDLTTRTEGEGETLDMPEGMRPFTPSQVLGERYQILEMLGRGGMGEVWHALDLKLRVEVALKALRPEPFKSERRLELLRQEVRAAREVVSPNVCRIFDLIEVEGRELVSMEFVDGATLLGVLQERGPLELKEAQDIASQFLAGLEAIHQAGLIHRDIKPENIMLTRAGRVVVMDFGLARQETEGGGTVAGTPAYMAPEQAAGQTLDARADVYAAGVVLAEMVSPDGIKSFDSRQSVWEGVRSEPAKVPDTPWAAVIQQAVKKDREGRFNSAHTLTRALEDVTLRVEGADDLHPYPGLASFTEDDAEYFFGREAEVEQMWRTLDRPHLLAVVGPSGAGKTSFLRAGLMPSAGPGWRILRCTPGSTPFTALGQAMAREMAGDIETMELLAAGHDPDALVAAVARWRNKHDHALVILDQFEELFTHNPPDTQRRFSNLIGRLALEADVFVMLSMRDDFLIRCREHEALAPTFTDLTALLAPTGAALRRALTQPALQCGYRFEDDELVDEMLAEVEGERGALPLLAFAAARLWERRDKDNGLLTREAYQEIGGVGGALAQHAEATIDGIGVERIPIVREFFRNLVTAEGTRAVHEWNELQSVFDEAQRASAEVVLHELVDARLLTSYEVREDEHEATRRVEIIHESLLANWPRLVRWQTQDVEGAQLRDELRQAARAWDEHGRHDDRLWTGTAYREYRLWQERYPGGLSSAEEAFAKAMTSFATRRQRQRRFAAATAFVVVLAVATVIGFSRQQAVAEARRAEAAKLLSIAQLELDEDNTIALAWVTASLKLADTREARRFALEALWRGPTRFSLEVGPNLEDVLYLDFSPDGTLLAANIATAGQVVVWSDSGEGPTVLGQAEPAVGFGVKFSPNGNLLAAEFQGGYRIWSVPGYKLTREVAPPEGQSKKERDRNAFWVTDEGLMTGTLRGGQYHLQSWPLHEGSPATIGWLKYGTSEVDAAARVLVFRDGRDLVLRPLDSLASPRYDRVIARHSEDIRWFVLAQGGDRVAALDETGLTSVWSTNPGSDRPLQVLRGFDEAFWFDPGGKRFTCEDRGVVSLREIAGPPDAEPLSIKVPHGLQVWGKSFDHSGRWMVISAGPRIFFWPLVHPYPHILKAHERSIPSAIAFVGDGRHLAFGSRSQVYLWPLSPEDGEISRELWENPVPGISSLAADPTGRFLLVSALYSDRGAHLLPIEEGQSAATRLWPADTSAAWPVAFSQDGRFAAAGALGAERDEDTVIRVWDLESGNETVLPLRDGSGSPEGGVYFGGVGVLRFTPDGGLISGGVGGVRLWDLDTGEGRWLYRVPGETYTRLAANHDTRFLLTTDEPRVGSHEGSNLTVHDRELGTSWDITSHGNRITDLAIDPTGAVIVTCLKGEGTIQVGSIDGSEPHLLLGHTGGIVDVDISPDGRWIATAGEDGTIRLWPMPDLSKPPLHTLPHDEFIAKLHTLTNLRVIRDEESSTGWKIEIGPFPGWAVVPEW